MPGGRAHPEFLALLKVPADEGSPGCRRALLMTSLLIAAAVILAAIVFGSR